MIEMLLVMGILTLSGMGVWQMFTFVVLGRDVQIEQKRITAFFEKAEQGIGVSGSFLPLTVTYAIEKRLFPSEMVVGDNLYHRWGGQVEIAPTTVFMRPNAGLTLIYHKVPSAACVRLVTSFSGAFLTW